MEWSLKKWNGMELVGKGKEWNGMKFKNLVWML